MNEVEYIEYFEALARKNCVLNHNPEDNKKSFFCINNPYETAEFDQALRSSAASTVFLLDAPAGYLSDNGSGNCTQTTKIEFLVLGKSGKENIRTTRTHCFQTGFDILARVGSDAKKKAIIPGRSIYFMNENITYDVVGPININYYGYAFQFNFVCPFSFSSESGAWTDHI
ncbi:MAG: hypothetical protein E6Q66_10290 [Pedobacter sp.]|nr:MAG: hypothetical protein E6Q66_10290 [Pedobacter sp.]